MSELETRINKWKKDPTQSLNLRNLRLDEWPKELKGLERKIIVLSCGGNKFTSLPKGLINLKKLFFDHTPLTTLPNDIRSIEKIVCDHHNLTKLWKGLDIWSNLVTLRCENGPLEYLPEGMIKLKELLCRNNKIEVLPDDMINIRILYCSNNQITIIPEGFTKLKEVECNQNPLDFFPGYLSNIKFECKDIRSKNNRKLPFNNQKELENLINPPKIQKYELDDPDKILRDVFVTDDEDLIDWINEEGSIVVFNESYNAGDYQTIKTLKQNGFVFTTIQMLKYGIQEFEYDWLEKILYYISPKIEVVGEGVKKYKVKDMYTEHSLTRYGFKKWLASYDYAVMVDNKELNLIGSDISLPETAYDLIRESIPGNINKFNVKDKISKLINELLPGLKFELKNNELVIYGKDYRNYFKFLLDK